MTPARRLACTLAALALSSSVSAQDGKAYWEEYDKLINNRKAVVALGPDLFGDSVDLATGALSFSVTDVSIPGNNALPVAVTRTYSAVSRNDTGGDYPFGDWEIDIPNISGLFSTTWHDDRCDRAVPPSVLMVGSQTTFESAGGQQYWKGNTAQMPGGGELLLLDAASPRPTTGGPYRWGTAGRAVFSCLPSVNNASGQGFFAVGADGTKYWFNHMAQYVAPDYSHVWQHSPGQYASGTVQRKKNALYVTRVEDRFGNHVTYSYSNAYNQPLKVDAITASDGRQITFGHSNGRISRVTAGGRSWHYGYAGGLSSVQQPDGSQWIINFAEFSRAGIEYFGTSDPNWRSCFRPGGLDPLFSGPFTGTVLHPSGAIGTFVTAPVVHGRSNVPAICQNYVPRNQIGERDTSNDYAVFPIKWHAISLQSKTIEGPALPSQTWSYGYGSVVSYFYPDGQTEPYKCNTESCAEPVCLSESCAGTSRTTVSGPDGWKRYTFGNSYRYNEGKLLKIEEGTGETDILRTTSKSYEFGQPGQPYPTRVGRSAMDYLGDGFTAEYPRPEIGQVIQQDGVAFSRTTDKGCSSATAYCLDGFLRPTRVVRSSSLGHSKVDETAFHDDLAWWVLGQVGHQQTNGVETQRIEYGSHALPWKVYSFGKLQSTLGYHLTSGPEAGTVASVTDGRELTTHLSQYKRGIPQRIQHPNGATESAVVNDEGWVLSATDESGATTCLGYDTMGRVDRVTPTSEAPVATGQPAPCDTSSWNATTIAFEPVNAVEHGIAAGHWRRTEQTGNALKRTYFDGFWRPVVEETHDAADPVATTVWTSKRYDAGGRLEFTSYPRNPHQSGAATWASALPGSHTHHDALGRPLRTEQDSEHGRLISTVVYLPGFVRQTTNPRQQSTRETFQAFDVPTFDHPLTIDAPEGTKTTISRDVFGKPTSMTRGASN